MPNESHTKQTCNRYLKHSPPLMQIEVASNQRNAKFASLQRTNES